MRHFTHERMPPQPNLFSSSTDDDLSVTRDREPGLSPVAEASAPLKSTPPAAKRRTAGQRLGVALMAAEFLLAVMVRIFIGVIVLALPWSPLWDNNHLLQSFPRLATFFSYGATRGVISGVGLLNLWIAVDETLHRGTRHT